MEQIVFKYVPTNFKIRYEGIQGGDYTLPTLSDKKRFRYPWCMHTIGNLHLACMTNHF